jgi:hypothetical protein
MAKLSLTCPNASNDFGRFIVYAVTHIQSYARENAILLPDDPVHFYFLQT